MEPTEFGVFELPSGTGRVEILRLRQDNYGYVLREGSRAVLIDTPAGLPLLLHLQAEGLALDWILHTHAHHDHTDGNLVLQGETACRIAGPAASSLPGEVAIRWRDGDRFAWGPCSFEVWDTPGHCGDHVSLVDRSQGLCFCGDVVFVNGCGRLLGGGDADTLWRSIQRLRELPEDTFLFCGHDYASVNQAFSLSVIADWDCGPALGDLPMPTTVGRERRHNLFWRADDPEVAAAVGLPHATPGAVFARLRALRDAF